MAAMCHQENFLPHEVLAVPEVNETIGKNAKIADLNGIPRWKSQALPTYMIYLCVYIDISICISIYIYVNIAGVEFDFPSSFWDSTAKFPLAGQLVGVWDVRLGSWDDR